MASQVKGKQVLPEFEQAIYGPALYAEVKHFRIQHPEDPDAHLIHTCLEGPENAVYARGVASSNQVTFPSFWAGLVRAEGITVHLTPTSAPAALALPYVALVTPYGFCVETVHALQDGPIAYSWYAVGVRADQPPLDVKQKKRAASKWRTVLSHVRSLLRVLTT
jgi:hypothetical protein